MTKRNVYCFLISFILLVAAPAVAHACGAKARAIASQENAVLLSVNASTNASGAQVCIIKLKIPSRDGKPERIVTRTVKK